MAHDGFEDLTFPRQYPQSDVSDNEVLMAFRNDEDAIVFRDWWHEEGKVMFQDYLNREHRT